MNTQDIILITLVFMFPFLMSAQNRFALTLELGAASNPSLEINREKVKNNYGLLIHSETGYVFHFYKKCYGEVGLATRYIYSSGLLNRIQFEAHTLRVQMPIKVGYRISPKWGVALGVAFQNSKDILDSDFRERFFWRPNLIAEGIYYWKDRWFFKGRLYRLIRDLPEGYLINDPKFGCTFGVGRVI